MQSNDSFNYPLGLIKYIVILFVKEPESNVQVEVIVDKYTMDTRHLVYELPGIYDTIISFPVSIMDGTAMLQIRNNTVFYSLHLSGLYSPLTAYRAVVSPIKCSYKIKPGQCHPHCLQSCRHPDKVQLQNQARSVSPSLPTELSSPR